MKYFMWSETKGGPIFVEVSKERAEKICGGRIKDRRVNHGTDFCILNFKL